MDKKSQEAFEKLKAFISSPVVPYPNPSKPFIIDYDATDDGIGAVLSCKCTHAEQMVMYFSKKLIPAENYRVTQKELPAVVKSLSFFHPYLYSASFTIRADHSVLQWLKSLRKI